MYESWQEFAERIGAAKDGADWLTASYLVIQNDHVGTHCDAVKHLRGPDAPGVEGIPLEYCYGDGVRLDFTDRPSGYRITPDDVDGKLAEIGVTLKERDIVLIHTGAGAYNTEERYRTDHCGMTAEATRHLIAQGVRMMGCDAITFDPPVWAMFEQKHFWEAHLVMNEEDYWHLENLTNLDQLPASGFKLVVLPVKWIGTTAAPVRAVAILDD
jgi:kynurenine formamidase